MHLRPDPLRRKLNRSAVSERIYLERFVLRIDRIGIMSGRLYLEWFDLYGDNDNDDISMF